MIMSVDVKETISHLDKNTQALVSNKIAFKNAKSEEQKLKMMDDSKEALRKLQYGRKTTIPRREEKFSKIQTLCNDMIKDREEDAEVFENLQAVFIAKKKAKNFTPSETSAKPVYKCNICIFSCPRESDCGCPCTKHFWYNCPQNDKGKDSQGGRGSRLFRGKKGKSSGNEATEADSNTFLT